MYGATYIEVRGSKAGLPVVCCSVVVSTKVYNNHIITLYYYGYNIYRTLNMVQ